jgi:hypothetical protein
MLDMRAGFKRDAADKSARAEADGAAAGEMGGRHGFSNTSFAAANGGLKPIGPEDTMPQPPRMHGFAGWPHLVHRGCTVIARVVYGLSRHQGGEPTPRWVSGCDPSAVIVVA